MILLFVGDPTSTQVIFTVVGIVGSAGIAATSLGVNMRINREMAGGTTTIRRRSSSRASRAGSACTGSARFRVTTAFACYLVAALA